MDILNESQKRGIDIKSLESIYKHKSNQFVLDCGVIMGALGLGLDMKLCLDWHYRNTPNFDLFIDSVNAFLKNQKVSLSAGDKSRLKSAYARYFNSQAGFVNNEAKKEILS
jgi:hypothetical protein